MRVSLLCPCRERCWAGAAGGGGWGGGGGVPELPATTALYPALGLPGPVLHALYLCCRQRVLCFSSAGQVLLLWGPLCR